eukprot:PITA_29602
MHGCKPVDTPLPGGWRKEDTTLAEVVDATVYQQLVGSLMYLVNTRPDICYAVNQLSQAMVKPTKLFWKAGKHVLRYLRGNRDMDCGTDRRMRTLGLEFDTWMDSLGTSTKLTPLGSARTSFIRPGQGWSNMTSHQKSLGNRAVLRFYGIDHISWDELDEFDLDRWI